MTIEELKVKYKDDADLIKYIEEQETRINKDYLRENLKLLEENKKLKADNSLLYSQITNRGATEEKAEAPFKDYTDEIIKELRNRK